MTSTAPRPRPRPLVIAGVVVAAFAVGAAAATGERLIEIAVIAVAGLAVSLGWPRLMAAPTPVGTSVVLTITTLALGGALAVQRSEPFLEQVPAAVAVGVIAMCLHPLVQESARADLARTLGGTALGVLVIACGAVLTSTVAEGSDLVVVTGIALGVAALIDLVTERGRLVRWMLPIGMLVGGIAGLGGQWALTGDLAPWSALVGVLGAGTALALRRVLSQQEAIDSAPGAVSAGVASVLLVGPLLHLVSRLPLG